MVQAMVQAMVHVMVRPGGRQIIDIVVLVRVQTNVESILVQINDKIMLPVPTNKMETNQDIQIHNNKEVIIKITEAMINTDHNLINRIEAITNKTITGTRMLI